MQGTQPASAPCQSHGARRPKPVHARQAPPPAQRQPPMLAAARAASVPLNSRLAAAHVCTAQQCPAHFDDVRQLCMPVCLAATAGSSQRLNPCCAGAAELACPPGVETLLSTSKDVADSGRMATVARANYSEVRRAAGSHGVVHAGIPAQHCHTHTCNHLLCAGRIRNIHVFIQGWHGRLHCPLCRGHAANMGCTGKPTQP